MKSTLKIVITLLIIMFASAFTGSFLIFASEQGFGSNLNTYEFYEEKSINIENIENIKLDFISSDITIKSYDGSLVKLIYSGNANTQGKEDTPKIISDISRNNLLIKIDETHSNFNFNNLFTSTYGSLDILIPNNYSGDLGTSGVSGDVLIEGLKLKSLSSESVSGNLRSINGDSNYVSFESVSGNILAEISGSVNVGTVSGNTRLLIPDNFNYKIDFESVSGNLDNNAPSNSDSGEFIINVESVSGDLDIRRLTNE